MNFFSKIAETFRQQGALTKIIALNVAIFLTVNVVANLSHVTNPLDYLALPVGGSQFLFRFWTLFTFMFTHDQFWHLFWNMLLLYFLSQVFFIIFGQKKLLYVYVMSGVAGGAMGLLFPESFSQPHLFGASSAILGVGAVMVIYTPDYRVNLFGVFAIPYKYLFLAIFVLNTIVDLSVNTGGKISHMGGTAFGLIYAYYLKRGFDFLNFSFNFKKKSRLKVISHNKSYSPPVERRETNDEQKMDMLLDKISRSGYESLTKNEKEELFKLSQKK
jgi:membrane associated rhomboid family serine protease